TTPDLQCAPDNVARIRDSLPIDYAYNDVDGVLFEAFQFPEFRYRNQSPIDIKRIQSLAFCPAGDVGVKPFARFHQRCENLQWLGFRDRLNLFHDRHDALVCDRLIAVWTKLWSGLCKQEPKKMVKLSERCDGRFASR